MTIQIGREKLLTLAQAAQHLPSKFGGQPLSKLTLWRYATKGCDGVLLDTLMFGDTTYTSLEALQRFGEALAKHRRKKPIQNDWSEARKARHRKRQYEELRKKGVPV